MRQTKFGSSKLVPFIVGLVFVLLTVPTASSEMIVPLIAGQHYDVGEVAIWQLDDALYVEFRLDEGYAFAPDELGMMSATNLHAFTDDRQLSDVPTAGGTRNPEPGMFDSNQRPDLVQLLITDDRLVQYTIPLERFLGHSVVHIAAHANVEGVFGVNGAATAALRTDSQSIDLDVVAPNSTSTVAQAEVPVYWEVRGTNITVDVASRGFEYQGPWMDDAGDSLENLHTYLGYTITSDQIVFSQDGQFSPGSSSTSLGDGLVFADWVGGSIDLTYEYNPLEGDVKWCGFPAGEYLDIVTITVSGTDKVVSETAWGEGPRFADRGNWAMYISFPIQDWEP